MKLLLPYFPMSYIRMIFIIFTSTANTARNQSERGKADPPELPDCNTGQEDLLEARNFNHLFHHWDRKDCDRNRTN